MIWGFFGDNIRDNLGTSWGLPGADLINLLLGNHIENSSGPFGNNLVTIGGAYLRPVGSIWLFLSFEPFIRKGERIVESRSNLGSYKY